MRVRAESHWLAVAFRRSTAALLHCMRQRYDTERTFNFNFNFKVTVDMRFSSQWHITITMMEPHGCRCHRLTARKRKLRKATTMGGCKHMPLRKWAALAVSLSLLVACVTFLRPRGAASAGAVPLTASASQATTRRRASRPLALHSETAPVRNVQKVEWSPGESQAGAWLKRGAGEEASDDDDIVASFLRLRDEVAAEAIARFLLHQPSAEARSCMTAPTDGTHAGREDYGRCLNAAFEWLAHSPRAAAAAADAAADRHAVYESTCRTISLQSKPSANAGDTRVVDPSLASSTCLWPLSLKSWTMLTSALQSRVTGSSSVQADAPTLGWALLAEEDSLHGAQSVAPRTMLHIDCDGCEWRALAELLEQAGPQALAIAGVVAIDLHARLDVPVQPEPHLAHSPVDKLSGLQTMAAAIALLEGSNFVPVWSGLEWPHEINVCAATRTRGSSRAHLGPVRAEVAAARTQFATVAAEGSEPILDAMTRLFGSSVAQTYEANAVTLQQLAKSEADAMACNTAAAPIATSGLAQAGRLACCWHLFLVRVPPRDPQP